MLKPPNRPSLTRARSSQQRAEYTPPWTGCSIIGIAGSSGSGKTSLALAITASLSLPWVVVLSMVRISLARRDDLLLTLRTKDSFYKVLTPDQSAAAFRNEYDFDSPKAIDFDVLVDRLRDLKAGRRAEVPIYSFEKHAREDRTNTMYSPHVLILEGIFALHDKRVLDMLDMKVFAEADADLCLSRRLVRDVRERGRDIEGCIKQWFAFVKPNFHRYVERQKEVADIIVPRGIENQVAIGMVSDHVRKTLADKSRIHQQELRKLDADAEDADLTGVVALEQRPQVVGMSTVLLDPKTDRENFVFYFDRLTALLIEKAVEAGTFAAKTVLTPHGYEYGGVAMRGTISAVAILRGGSIMERGLRRVIPDCTIGRLLIQTKENTVEPELHYLYLPPNISGHARVLLLDPQMSSGGAALMAVRVLVDHGVEEKRIVFVTYFAGRKGLARLMAVFPDITVVVCRVGEDLEQRWLEAKYLGC